MADPWPSTKGLELSDEPKRSGQMAPLLTAIIGALFLATAVVGTVEAVALNQAAEALAAAPVCTSADQVTNCRLRVNGLVEGGYDEGSGLARERHIDVKAPSGALLHLTSPIIGSPPQIGSPVPLEYWKGKLVRFATTSGTFRTGDHPSLLSRSYRLSAWFALGLALFFTIVYLAAFRRGRPLPGPPAATVFRLGVSRWFFGGIGLVMVFGGFSELATDGFTYQALVSGLKHTSWLVPGLSLVFLSAIARTVTVSANGLTYRRHLVAFHSITKVTLEPSRLPFSGLRIVVLHLSAAARPLAIDTKYFGWRNRVRLLQVLSSFRRAADFDADWRALLAGAAVGKQAPIRGSSTWQSQNRGCAMALLGVGSLLMLFGLFFETLGGPQIGGLWSFAVGAIFVGIGIHRNIKVLRAYFGRPQGDLLFLLQILVPLVAWGIETVGEVSSNGPARLLFRLLSLLPFAVVWLLIWLPLSKAHESIADQTLIA